MIRIEINDDEVNAAFARAMAAMGDLTPFMQGAGLQLVRSTKDRMLRGEQPDGAAFAPRSQVTLERYARTGQRHGPHPLNMEGFLIANIHHDAGPDYLELGSNALQAAVMQFGAAQGQFGASIGRDKRGRDHFHTIPWGDIPARPFLGLSEDDRTGLLADLADWLAEAADGR